MARPKTVFAPLLAVEKSLTIAQVNANTTNEQEFTVSGVRKNHPYFVSVNDGTNPLDAGLGVVNVFASDKDKLKIRFMNTTSGNITPGATLVQIVGF